MFVEKLGGYQHDIFARTTVLAVGHRPIFLWLLDGKAYVRISCTCLTKWSFKMIADLDKYHLTVSSNNTCSGKAVDP